MTRKIITLSGRQGTGKTEFANIAVQKYGFKKIAIADRLKEVVAELYNIPLNTLIDPQLKQQQLQIPWVWNKDTAFKLEKITGLNLDIDIDLQEFQKPREALQYIGTDVIRKVDENFHIKECIKKIDYINDHVVVDDQRFPSERLGLEKYNPCEYYIIRPYYFEYSNHSSEISLNRSMFDNVILNTKGVSEYRYHTNQILTYLNKKDTDDIRYNKNYWQNLLNENDYNLDKIAKKINIARDSITRWLKRHGIYYSRATNDYNQNCFLFPNELNSYVVGYLSGDGCISKRDSKYPYAIQLTSIDIETIRKIAKLTNYTGKITEEEPRTSQMDDYILIGRNKNYRIKIQCPYMIEDLKRWDFVPREFTKYKNTIPTILQDQPHLLKFWITGLIDADGCIYVQNNKCNNTIVQYPQIHILASEPTIDGIQSYLNINCSKIVRSQKDHNTNLYDLRYAGKYAREVYSKLKNEYCLSRKWDKIKHLI